MTCFIVDDEPLAVKLIESMVARTPDLELRGSFTDSIAALEALQRETVDLLFLDIQMPDLNGMELAHAIDNHRTRIIFTTAFKDYAFESYEVNALDFLLKPIRYVKFQAAIDKARQHFAAESLKSSMGSKGLNSSKGLNVLLDPSNPSNLSNSSNPSNLSNSSTPSTLFLRIDGELRQLSLQRLIYVEAMKDYLKFYIEGERSPWVTHLTLSAAEELLPSSQFMRIHRSYIISLSHIRSIDRNDCVYIADQIIRVTDAYKEAFSRYVEQHVAH